MKRRDLLRMLSAAALCNRRGFAKSIPATSQAPLFVDATADVGLNFHHFSGATGEYFMPEIMGSGVALFDYNNDGALDIFLVQGTALVPGKRSILPAPPGWKPGNRLFRNELTRTGRLKFTDVTEEAGLAATLYGMGVATGDYNNDGFLDLFVTGFGRCILYRNNGDGTFTDVTAQSGIANSDWATSASWFDYDNDGNLDLFVVNYLDFTVKGNKRCYATTGEFDYCTPKMYRPVAARLFHNLGNGKFQDVTEESGIGSLPGPGLGAIAADFNNDGWPDIFVANDGAPNYMWLNQKNGTFKETGLPSGVAYNGEGAPQGSMGIALGDISNRGMEDLLVTNLTREGCTFYRNDGKGNFYDATAEFGLLQPTFPYTGFGAQWFDYDNDGFLDLFIANGAVTKLESSSDKISPYQQTNQLFHNEGGKRFRETTHDAGSAFKIPGVGRGAAFGDINNDGCIDIVFTSNNGPARLLLNNIAKTSNNHWVQIQLRQPQRNIFAIGASIELHHGSHKQIRRVHTDSSYLSANDVRAHFGLGSDTKVDRAIVVWPDGSRESFEKISADTIVTLYKRKRSSGITVNPHR